MTQIKLTSVNSRPAMDMPRTLVRPCLSENLEGLERGCRTFRELTHRAPPTSRQAAQDSHTRCHDWITDKTIRSMRQVIRRDPNLWPTGQQQPAQRGLKHMELAISKLGAPREGVKRRCQYTFGGRCQACARHMQVVCISRPWVPWLPKKQWC